jgi:hypothetical protein
VKLAFAFLVVLVVALGGVLLGAWWMPFVAGAGIGLAIPRARASIGAGALVGLLAWGLPLAYAHARFGIGGAARSLAAIMGFGGQPGIPLGLTLLVGLLLGLTGAWLGAAARGARGRRVTTDGPV